VVPTVLTFSIFDIGEIMPSTTFLNLSEIEFVVKHEEIKRLLDELNRNTPKSNPYGKNIVVIETQFNYRHPWWYFNLKKDISITRYKIYAYVGGMGDWQDIHLEHDEYNDLYPVFGFKAELVLAYFYGLINGANKSTSKYHGLLARYLNHIGDVEGTCFLGKSAVGVFTPEEIKTLEELSNG
jgi:hypothetical protein